MKKLATLLLAMIMVLGMLPSALADNNAAGQLVHEGGIFFYDANGHQTTDTNFPGGDAVVKLSKTVAPTGVENEFEVHLQVSTTQNILELKSDTPDAAAMLILDVSNSMDDCDTCGKEENDSVHGTTVYYCPGNSGDTYESGRTSCSNCRQAFNKHIAGKQGGSCDYISRLAKAKEAAIDFLDDFAKDTGAETGDKRYVAIVDFGSMALTRQTWVDVTNSEYLAEAKAIISGLTVAHSGTNYSSDDSGGTNIEAALMLGANLWNSSTVEDIDYKYTILLTDGNPTFHVTDNENSRTSSSAIYGTVGGSTATNYEDAKDVGTQAKRILDLGSLSKLYSICYGSVKNGSTVTKVWDTKPFEKWDQANPKTTKNTTIGQWLEAFSTAAFDGAATNLFDSFNSIVSQIQLAAQAWKVEDTMGAYAVYGGEVPQSFNNKHTVTGSTLEWDVLNSNTASITEHTNNSKKYAVLNYSFKYNVKLDNLNSGYEAYTSADTNDIAELTYAVLDSETGLWDVLEPVEFPEPQVQGYDGELRFRKVWLDDSEIQPVAKMQFELTPTQSSATGTTWSGTATSDDNGWVTISDIPSGHDYYLKEVSNTGDYVDPGELPVSVKWGAVSSSAMTQESDGLQLINEKAVKSVSLTLNKTFGSAEHPASIRFVITNESIGYRNEVTLNEKSSWTATLTGLTPGSYTITEYADWTGYDLTSSATLEHNDVSTVLDTNYGNVLVNLALDENESSASYTVAFHNTYEQKVGNVSISKTFWERVHSDMVSGEGNVTLEPLDSSLYENAEIEVELVDANGSLYGDVLILNKDNNWNVDLTNVPIGDYTIAEITSSVIPDHDFVHAHIMANGVAREDGKITVGQNSAVTVALQNHYTHQMGDIRVVKSLIGLEQSELPAGHIFTVGIYETIYNDKTDEYTATNELVTTIEVKQQNEGAMVGQSEDIPVGVYWLEEMDGTAIPGYNFNGSIFDSQLIEVRQDITSTNVNLTNAYEKQTGSLTVSKTFVVLPEEYESSFVKPASIDVQVLDEHNVKIHTLHLTSSNNYSDSVELPLGIYYLNEITAEGAQNTAAVEDYGVTESWRDGSTVQITTDGQHLTREVVNTYRRDYGKLMITKRFEGIRAEEADLKEYVSPTFVVYDSNQEFVTTISLPNDNLTSSDPNRWTKTIDLPVGNYSIVERGARDALTSYHYTFSGLEINDEVVDLTNGYSFTVDNENDEPVVTTLNAVNTYTKDVGNLTIKKAFAEGSDLNADFFKGKPIAVQVLKDGVEIEGSPVLLSSADWTATLENLEAGVDYTLVEVHTPDAENTAYVPDYDLTYSWSNGARVSLTKDGAENTVTNSYKRQTGTLAVRKFFSGITTADMALLNDASISIAVKQGSETIRTITLTRNNNWDSGVITLPVGEYTLEEDEITIPGYTHTDAIFTSALHGDQVVDGNGKSATVIVKNGKANEVDVQLTNTMKQQTGSLTIEKKFAYDSDLTAANFGNINVLVRKGGAIYQTVTLNEDNKWAVTLSNVPVGDYQVEEVTAAGQTNTAYVKDYGLHVTYTNQGRVTVTDGGNHTMTVTNDYKQHVGYLRVTKAFTQDADTLAAEKFITRIAIQLRDKDGNLEDTKYVSREGASVTFGPLPVGDYTVEEVIAKGAADSAYVEDYTLTSVWSVEGGKLTVENGETAEATVTNTYTRDKGSITVNKIVYGPAAASDKTFTVYVKQDGVTVDTLYLSSASGWTATTKKLPTGNYLLVEDEDAAQVDDYSLKVSYSAQNVTVANEQTASATITNTYTRHTGALRLNKTFMNLEDGVSLSGKSIVLSIESKEGGESRQVTLSAPTWATSLTLDVGTYTITEVTPAEVPGYAYSGVRFIQGDNAVDDEITVDLTTAGVQVTAENSYTRDTGSLTIQKAFAPDSALTGSDFDAIDVVVKKDGVEFQRVTLLQTEEWTKTISLPTGVYTVEEVKSPDEDNTAYRVNYGLTVTGEGNVTVDKDGQQNITVTNSYTRDTGSLTIQKAFAPDSALTGSDFDAIDVVVKKDGVEFQRVTLYRIEDWTKTISLPTGVYTVEEVKSSDEDNTAYRVNYGLTVTGEGNVTVDKDGQQNITVTNSYTRDTGSLTIQKAFAPDSALTGSDFDAIDVVVKKDGVEFQRVTLLQTEEWTKTISLPTGAYTVEEVKSSDEDNTAYRVNYGLTVTGEGNVTVDKDGQQNITVINSYTRDMGHLTIQKAFAPDSALTGNDFDAIDVVVKKDGVEFQRVTLLQTEEWIKTISLPTGVYTVEEVKSSDEANTAYRVNYGLTVTGEGNVTVDKDGQQNINVTNSYTRDNGQITINKVFAGVEAADLPTDLTVVINLTPEGAAAATEQITLSAANQWTATVSVPTGTYSLSEEMPEIPNYTASNVSFSPETVIVSEKIPVTVTAVNTYAKNPGKLTITKVLKGTERLFPASIKFTIEGQSVLYNKVVELSRANNWTCTIEGIPAGEYIVREDAAAGHNYKVTTEWSSEGGKVTILPDQTAALTCTNTYEARLSIRIPVEKTVALGGTAGPDVPNTFAFAAKWAGGRNVAVRFENDPLNTAGALRQTSPASYQVTVNDHGTVKGYIVLEGYADDLLGFHLQTRELLTGYDSALQAQADGWVFDQTATTNSMMWNVKIVSDGKGGLRMHVYRTGEEADSKISFVNTYTNPADSLPPQTGDDATPLLWLALCILSGSMIMVSRKRIHNQG